MIALSLRQPWCWVVLNLGKDLENRHWSTDYRGEFLMHASKAMTKREYYECIEFCQGVLGTSVIAKFPALKALPRGGIVGAARIVDVIPPCKDCETHPEHGVIRPCGKNHGWHMTACGRRRGSSSARGCSGSSRLARMSSARCAPREPQRFTLRITLAARLHLLGA